MLPPALSVLPLTTWDLARLNVERPSIARPRQKYVYQPGGNALPFAASPRVYNRPHSITADIVIPEEGGDGVLLCHGNRHGGYSFYMKDGYLCHVHNYMGKEAFKVTSPEKIPTGEASLRYEFEPTGELKNIKGKGTSGRSQLYVNGELVASVDLPYTVPNLFGIIGLCCGRDATDSVVPGDYQAPFAFNGEIKSVTLDVLRSKQPASMVEKLANGREVVLGARPVFDESSLRYLEWVRSMRATTTSSPVVTAWRTMHQAWTNRSSRWAASYGKRCSACLRVGRVPNRA